MVQVLLNFLLCTICIMYMLQYCKLMHIRIVLTCAQTCHPAAGPDISGGGSIANGTGGGGGGIAVIGARGVGFHFWKINNDVFNFQKFCPIKPPRMYTQRAAGGCSPLKADPGRVPPQAKIPQIFGFEL